MRAEEKEESHGASAHQEDTNPWDETSLQIKNQIKLRQITYSSFNRGRIMTIKHAGFHVFLNEFHEPKYDAIIMGINIILNYHIFRIWGDS